jgi:hypothetical protein
MFKRYFINCFFLGIMIAGVNPAHSSNPTLGFGWYPSDNSLHYHVQQVWYDTRPSKNRIGLLITEKPGYTFLFNYFTSSQISISQAGAIYSTLLTSLSTGQEVHLDVNGIDGTCVDCYNFDMAAVGAQ